MKINKKLETEINEIIQPILNNKKKNQNYEYLLDEFNQRYEETKYPGFKYAIGVLYENNIVYSNKPRKYLIYYDAAANQNYLPALIRLSKIYLYDVYYETTLHGVTVYSPDNYESLKDDAYGEYLLAKYGMIRSIVMNDEHEDFNDALALMKDSANKGFLDAKEFLKKTKLDASYNLDILKNAA